MFSVGGIAAADDIKKFFCKKETEDENQTSNVDIDQKYCDTYLNTNLPQKEKLLTLEASSSIEEEAERKPWMNWDFMKLLGLRSPFSINKFYNHTIFI